MAKRSLFTVLTATLFAIGAFVYLSPSAPTAEMKAAAARSLAAANASATRSSLTADGIAPRPRREAQGP